MLTFPSETGKPGMTTALQPYIQAGRKNYLQVGFIN